MTSWAENGCVLHAWLEFTFSCHVDRFRHSCANICFDSLDNISAGAEAMTFPDAGGYSDEARVLAPLLFTSGGCRHRSLSQP